MLEHGRHWCNLKSSHMYWNRPFYVSSIYIFMVTNTWEFQTKSICWYALERSSLETVWPPDRDVNSSSIVSNGYTSNLVFLFAACECVNSTNSHSATSFYHWCNRCGPAWELHRFDHNVMLQTLQVLIESIYTFRLPLFNKGWYGV